MQVQDAIGYQSKGVFFGADSEDMAVSTVSPSTMKMPDGRVTQNDHVKRSNIAGFEILSAALHQPGESSSKPSRHRRGPSKGNSVNLESATNIEIAEAEATQVPLRLVSDMVRICQPLGLSPSFQNGSSIHTTTSASTEVLVSFLVGSESLIIADIVQQHFCVVLKACNEDNAHI